MFENIEWIFFDVGSTIVDEHFAYKHRMNEMADLANTTYSSVYETAMEFYKQNKKGDLETAKLLGIDLPKWHKEDEILYSDASKCLEILSGRYKIGIIANQSPGTKERLEQYGVLQYIDLVIASAEEGVAKPDKIIFEIALERGNCNPNNAVMGTTELPMAQNNNSAMMAPNNFNSTPTNDMTTNYFCPNCGAKNIENNNFCTNCGDRLK